jgi:hypothetical protein
MRGWVMVAAAALLLGCGDGGEAVDAGPDAPNGTDGGVDATSDAAPPDAATSDAPADAPADVSSDVTTGWQPTSLSGLSVWLRADQVTTDTSGVSLWQDLSGHHNDFTPGGTHPTVIASAINGKPAVDMTTINAFTGHADTVGTGPVLVEIVAAAIQKSGTVLVAASASNTSLVIGTGPNGSARAWEATSSPVATASSGVVVNDNKFHILGAVVDGSGNISLRVDGALAAGPTSGATLDLGKLDTTNIAGDLVAELVVVVGAVSAGDLGSLETYLKARYAL